MVVDPNPGNPIAWRRMTAIKPNRVETIAALGLPLDLDRPESLGVAARQLQGKWETGVLLITLGERGMWLFEGDNPPFHRKCSTCQALGTR